MSRSCPSTRAARQPFFRPSTSVITSEHVMPAAYSLTVPSGSVMLISANLLSPTIAGGASPSSIARFKRVSCALLSVHLQLNYLL